MYYGPCIYTATQCRRYINIPQKGHPAWGPWINMDQLDPFILEVQKVLDIFWLIV